MQLLESELAPESILPAQLYDQPLGGARIQPEKRLQVAVLADAILTFHRCAGDERARARRHFAEVDAWFASDDTNGPFIVTATGLGIRWCSHGSGESRSVAMNRVQVQFVALLGAAALAAPAF